MTPLKRCRRAPRGFSLIEISIVLVILGLLSAMAYPSYVDHVRRARRADAQAVMMQAAGFLERFYTENMRYDQDAAGQAVALPAAFAESPLDGATKYYTISLESVAPRSYLLRAVPKNAQADDACDTMRLSQTGVRTAAQASCWQR